MFIFGKQPPAHLAGRHLASKNSIYLIANSTSYIVLTFHLLLQASLVKAVICAFAHYDNLNRHLATHLLPMHFFHFDLVEYSKVIIQFAHANGAGLLIIVLSVTVSLFLSDF
jgi:hypothetical protein